MKYLVVVGLLVLTGCSGVSRICALPPPEGSGLCQETIRDVGAISHTTSVIVTDTAGKTLDTQHPLSSLQAGWIAQVNPIASLAPSSLTAAGTLATDIKALQK
jgi:hypothetical protein